MVNKNWWKRLVYFFNFLFIKLVNLKFIIWFLVLYFNIDGLFILYSWEYFVFSLVKIFVMYDFLSVLFFMIVLVILLFVVVGNVRLIFCWDVGICFFLISLVLYFINSDKVLIIGWEKFMIGMIVSGGWKIL